MSNRYFEINKKKWNELATKHYENNPQYVQDFIENREGLHSVEIEEMGDVRGKRLLHLQCHFGMDTLAWAIRGAIVTGVDFSEVAIANARDLAQRMNLEAKFAHCNICDLKDHLNDKFDVVFTSYGAICWLNDLEKWAEIIAHFLVPDGYFYVADAHPFALVFDNDKEQEFAIKYDYFESESKTPLRFEEDSSYMNPEIKLQNTTEFTWQYTISGIINSLVKHGLSIDWLHEHPKICWKLLDILELADDGWWYWPKAYEKKRIPLLFSLKATKRNDT